MFKEINIYSSFLSNIFKVMLYIKFFLFSFNIDKMVYPQNNLINGNVC